MEEDDLFLGDCLHFLGAKLIDKLEFL